jgi:hypothetical protein
LNRLLVPRVLATGSLMSVATVIRVGTNCAALVAERLPPLVRTALEGSAGRSGAKMAQAAFRDELIALARDSAEVSWREMRRGVDDLDSLTRTDDRAMAAGPYRPYRAKP